MNILRIIIYVYFLSCALVSYSQSAFSNLAANYAESGNFEEAIRLEKMSLELLDATNDHSELYANSLCNLGRYYHFMGQTQESVRIINEALIKLKQEETFDSIPYLYVYQDLGAYNFTIKDYSESIRNSLIALSISKLGNSSNSVSDVFLLDNIAYAYYNLEDYKKALIYGERAVNSMSFFDDVDCHEVLSLLTNYSLYLDGDKQISKAQEIIESALNYANANNIAISNQKFQRTLIISIELYEESKNISRIRDLSSIYYNSIKDEIHNLHPALLENIHRLAYINYSNGNYNEAIKFKELIHNYYLSTDQKLTEDCANALNDLSVYYMDISDFDVALKYINEVMDIREQLLGKRNISYIDALDNYALILSKLNKYNDVIKIGKDIFELAEGVVGNNSIEYVGYLHNQANRFLELGDFKNALAMEHQGYNICKAHIAFEHPYYLISSNGLITMYGRLNLYNEALKYGKEILDEYKRGYIQINNDNYLALINIASLFHNLDDYESALELASPIHDFIIKQWGKDHLNYLYIVEIFASSLVNIGQTNEARTIVQDLIKTYGDVKNIDAYIRALDIAAKIYYIAGAKHSCYDLLNEKQALLKQQYGENDIRNILAQIQYIKYMGNDWYNHGVMSNVSSLLTDEFLKSVKAISIFSKDYELLLRLKCSLCFSQGKFKDLMKYVAECNDVSTKIMRNNIYSLTANEMKQFWQDTNGWFKEEINLYASECCYPPILKEAYNAVLFSKGMLLNSEIELDKFITKIGSDNILEKFSRIKILRNNLNKIYEKPFPECLVNTDSLEMQINELERLIKLELKRYGDYTNNLSIYWDDVKDNLNSNEVAIEFVSFPLSNNSVMYLAYVLKHGSEAPELVKLFEEKELVNMIDVDDKANIYTDRRVTELIWTKLYSQLEGIENIYFAPDGILHQIAIEYLPDIDGDGLISDRYNLHRLSSTRELAIKRHAEASMNAVVYGGISYDTDLATLEEKSRKYDLPKTRGFEPNYNLGDSITLRGSLEYLDGSLIEAENIDGMMKEKEYNSTFLSGNDATEESFKNLSGQAKGIIHISTHGFYWSEDKAERKARLNDRLLFMSQLGDDVRKNEEDKALTRSGLYMAGAKNALAGIKLPDDVDDGLLTAQEIANLDLRGLDLVVLSACQTGMGDISGDGVFGLQRGFKKAGANTILMSLWDVSDEATQKLMTEFYKNFLNGKSKREALLAAQKVVRETPGFEDPEYWAAFILLDALN